MNLLNEAESAVFHSGIVGGQINKATHWAVGAVLGSKAANGAAGIEAAAVTSAAVATVAPKLVTPEALVTKRVTNILTANVAKVQATPAEAEVIVPSADEITAEVKADFDEMVKEIIAFEAAHDVKINPFALLFLEEGTDFGIGLIVHALYAQYAPQLTKGVETVEKIEQDFAADKAVLGGNSGNAPGEQV